MLDRDGTINVERRYLADPDRFELLPGAAEGMRLMQAAGFGLAVITNQSAVARGMITRSRLDEIHDRMVQLLAVEGVHLAGIFVCPHSPDDGCACRKPLPGLVRSAEAELGFLSHESVMIGDNGKDIELGVAVGARTVLVRTGYGRETEASGSVRPDAVADGLLEAARYVIATTVAANTAKAALDQGGARGLSHRSGQGN
jgi:D-glycero-D-manno-heptose 1,7-bisphosphate phosphatase